MLLLPLLLLVNTGVLVQHTAAFAPVGPAPEQHRLSFGAAGDLTVSFISNGTANASLALGTSPSSLPTTVAGASLQWTELTCKTARYLHTVTLPQALLTPGAEYFFQTSCDGGVSPIFSFVAPQPVDFVNKAHALL